MQLNEESEKYMNASFLWEKFLTWPFVRQRRRKDNIQLALMEIRCKHATHITRILYSYMLSYFRR
jgi:predicted transcriptional regulator